GGPVPRSDGRLPRRHRHPPPRRERGRRLERHPALLRQGNEDRRVARREPQRARDVRDETVPGDLLPRFAGTRPLLLRQQARLVEARGPGLPGEPALSLAARLPAPEPAPASRRGLPPLPLLTLVNFFNYLDR